MPVSSLCLRTIHNGTRHGMQISRFSTTLTIFATHVPLGSGTSSNPFPYPEHDNPTPQQIFHLPFGATQNQIKGRYYELVRIHHPDSIHAAPIPPELAHDRFRSIKAAYDFLCGRTLSPHPNSRPAPSPKHFDPYLHELSQRRRAHHASRGQTSMGQGDTEGWARPGWADGFGAPKGQQGEWNENGWRERFILSFGVVVLLAGLFPTLPFTLTSIFLPISHAVDANVTASTTTHNFIPDIHKNHRAAVSSLVQAREECREVGMERRQGVRQRVRELNDLGAVTQDDHNGDDVGHSKT